MTLRNLLVAGILCVTTTINAQTPSSQQQLQVDPDVRTGKLSNGLTYYIRHNEWPEERAYFYIAQKVGSIQEEDNQKGLAHFLEHMCFNGTKNFPGNGIKQYLEKIGVKFGENLNAYTSFDETVYNIDNVPVTREGAIDSCLLILHDWSHNLLLEDDEIDKERGVINEEWRMRRSAMMRMYESAFPTLYKGSKYANRMPIGTMDVVMNFKYEDLRNYYRKWYRPDLQAIVVVGDVDIDDIEQKIKTMFSDIKAVENPAERIYYPVPDNKEPIVDIQKDKEQENTLIYLMVKHEAFPDSLKSTPLYYARGYISGAIGGMFGDRISEILHKENAPFLGADFSDGGYLVSGKTKGSFIGATICKDNGHEEALTALYREILRIKRYGFTQSEFDRYKENFLSSLENAYANKEKVNSSDYVSECVDNFLDNEPMPGIEWEYKNLKIIADGISLEDINKRIGAYSTDSNLVIAMFCPDKPEINYPTKEELLNILKKVEAEDIEAYEESVSDEPLINDLPASGKIKSIKADAFDAKLITLSNGIKVHVKKTDFSPNSISMTAVSWGGNSLYPDSDYLDASSTSMVALGGIGNYSAIDLTKRLSGKQVNINTNVGIRTEGVNGSCVKKDLETLLQITYLTFTAPRKDEPVFKASIERSKESMQNQELNPNTAFCDTIAKVLYNNNIRALRTKPETLDKLNYDHIIQIYKERFADANDFEFFFIGDIDADSVAPMLEKYLGALPTLKSKEKYKKVDMLLAKGERKNVFEKDMQTPSANILFMFHAPLKDNLRNSITLSMLTQNMNMYYTESIREDEGGAYSVPISSSLSDYPEEVGLIQITLPTSPEKRERMTELIYEGIDDVVENGPKQENIDKIKEYMTRKYAENLKRNGFWLNAMINKARYGKDNVTPYEETLNSITAADIQEMAKTIFKSGNRIEVGMTSPIDSNKEAE